jgi:flagellar biogenesis protein FliO
VEIFQQLTIVLIVFGLLAATLWVLREKGLARLPFPAARGTRPRRMRSIERLALTPHHSLHLIDIDGKQMVIGLSPSGCQVVLESVQAKGAN